MRELLEAYRDALDRYRRLHRDIFKGTWRPYARGMFAEVFLGLRVGSPSWLRLLSASGLSSL